MRYAMPVLMVVGSIATAAYGQVVSTDEIKTLSVAQAEALVKERLIPGDPSNSLNLDSLTSITPEVVAVFPEYRFTLYLCGLRAISDQTAKALSKHKGGMLLPNVTLLSPVAADSLAQAEGCLALGLTKLPADLAAALAKHRDDPHDNELGGLYLDGVKELSDDSAKALAEHVGTLTLGSVTSLSDAAAIALAKHDGALNLRGLTTLSERAARALLANNGVQLSENLQVKRASKPASVPKQVGDALPVDPSEIQSLTVPQAEKLIRVPRPFLNLYGLTELSPEVAGVLARYEGDMYLGIAEISPQTAATLAKHKGGRLSFSKLQKVSPNVAEALVKHAGDLCLDRVVDITPQVAQLLAKSKYRLSLEGLVDLSPEVAAGLAMHRGDELRLHGIVDLSPDVAKKLAAYAGPRMSFFKLTDISPEVAEIMVECKGEVAFGSRAVRQEAVAEILRKNPGVWFPGR